MLDKVILNESIQDLFPDLVNTKFWYNNKVASLFTEQALLPFLVYQNTIDDQHRLIGLYLPVSCSVTNLIPFYIMMGHYRKALNSVMQQNDYQVQTFKPNEKQIYYNGGVYSLISVDFINRQITFKSGVGKIISVSFLQSYNIKWGKSSLDIGDKIDSFERIDNASQQNIFTFPIPLNYQKTEGVIIFTNTSKFENLLQNVKVSGTDFREHLRIEKAVFSSNGVDIKFELLSKPNTRKKPVSLIIARIDAFRSYDLILAAGKGKLGHIKTVIIDDFDELIKRWENTDTASEEIKILDEVYFQKIAQKRIKDFYFISNNSSLNVHEFLKKFGITYNPWLLKPLEDILINEGNIDFVPKIALTDVQSSRFENLNHTVNSLIAEWKNLAESTFCNGDILTPIKLLYDLRTKVNSFFNPNNIETLLANISLSIEQLFSKWFSSGQDYGVINRTRKLLEEIVGKNDILLNYKLDIVIRELTNNRISGQIHIVSDNNDLEDINWLTEAINTAFPDIMPVHYYKSEFIASLLENNERKQLVFYLFSDKKCINTAVANILGITQFFILNKVSFQFAKFQIEKYRHLQAEVGQTNLKYELLNLNQIIETGESTNSGLIDIQYIKKEIVDPKNESQSVEKEFEIQELLEEVIQKHYNNASSKVSLNKYMLFFDDGTFIEVLNNKRFFIYEDDKEFDEIDKVFKNVTALRTGDQVIIAKRALNIKDLLEQTLNTKEEYRNALEIDKQWRVAIAAYLDNNNLDLEQFSQILLNHHFKIGESSIRHWIDSETRRPDNFPKLLRCLYTLNIISENQILLFDKCNSDLKSFQISFVRTAIRKLIARLHGINYHDDDVFNDDMLSDFLNHIEIKRINSIYKL